MSSVDKALYKQTYKDWRFTKKTFNRLMDELKNDAAFQRALEELKKWYPD